MLFILPHLSNYSAIADNRHYVYLLAAHLFYCLSTSRQKFKDFLLLLLADCERETSKFKKALQTDKFLVIGVKFDEGNDIFVERFQLAFCRWINKKSAVSSSEWFFCRTYPTVPPSLTIIESFVLQFYSLFKFHFPWTTIVSLYKSKNNLWLSLLQKQEGALGIG